MTDDAGGTAALARPLSTDPPWLTRAWQDLGKTEAPGAGNAAWIMALPGRFARWVQRYYTLDSIPWCALWLSACLKDVGIEAPANPLGALAYKTWGIARPHAMRRGAIVVLTRAGGGHVGFSLGADLTTMRVLLLSGNSHDKVSVDWFPINRVVAVRWPMGAE